jgi:RES domain-containing protein
MLTRFREHGKSQSLGRGIARCEQHVGAWSSTLFRVVAAKYANTTDLISGEGARSHGGRWNPPFLFSAIYGSLDPFVALAETLGTYDAYGIPFEQRMPLVLVGIRVQLSRLLDITDAQVRRGLGVSTKTLLSEDWQAGQLTGVESLTQAIGRLAWEARIEAIAVPSARTKRAKNIVLYPDILLESSHIEIVNRQELPEPR